MRIAALFWSVVVLVGCGGSESASISMEPLAGTIGGQAWTFGTGETTASLSTADQFWVDLYPGSFQTCALASPATSHVIMMMPRTPGDYDLGFQLTTTLYTPPGTNLAATRGRLVIDSVDATTIRGGLHATYNDSNSVDGQFQASICP